jgi:hypothetical protein
LLDTGAPISFGETNSLVLENRLFNIPDNYMGLTAAKLTELVGHPTAGIIGGNILNVFDTLFDLPQGQVSFSEAELFLDGDVIKTDEFMGIPIIQAHIAGATRRMIFDSGAQLSYLQDESLTKFPAAGTVTDFYPGVGQFRTETYLVETTVGEASYVFRCGVLPALLGMTLLMANTEGILGNEILLNREVGYYPRRQQLVLT